MRSVRAHTYVVHELRDSMPSMFGKEAKQRALVESLDTTFRSVHKKRNIPPGDFPDLNKFKSVAREMNFTEFPRIDGSRLKNGKLMTELDRAMSEEIPRLMENLQGIAEAGAMNHSSPGEHPKLDDVYR